MTKRAIVVIVVTFFASAALIQGYQIISILNEMPTTAKSAR